MKLIKVSVKLKLNFHVGNSVTPKKFTENSQLFTLKCPSH